jgi:hypothetical protein
VYRGEKYHKHCARAQRERDLSVEQVGPQKDQDQADLEAWLENMTP